MRNQAMWKGLVIAFCIPALAGCGAGTGGMTEGGDLYRNRPDAEDVTLDEQDDIAPDADGDIHQKDREPEADSFSPDENGTGGADVPAEKQNDITANNADGKADAESLFASAALTGSVVDFSDDGCTVSPAVTEDDGKTGVIAAPGYESGETNVAVTYQKDCEVWIATIDILAGTAELEQASAADIKKQASVIIYGSFEDTRCVSADKIIIYHWTA